MFAKRFVGHCVFLMAAAASVLALLERSAFADCNEVAKEEMAVIGGGQFTVESALLTEGGKVTKLPGLPCATDAACALPYFQVSATKPAAAPVTTPEGYTAPKGWSPVAGTVSQKTCPNLYEWVFKKEAVGSPTGGRRPAPAPANAVPRALSPAHARLLSAQDLATALSAFKEARAAYAASPGTVGTAQMDLTAAANETLQILGQIVVDRASNKAYQVLQDKLKTLLDCSDPATHFPSTCAAVASLRIQDLATAPTVLFNALAKDLVSYVGTSWPGPASQTLAAGVFASAVVPLVAKPGIAQDAHIRAVIDSLSSYVASQNVAGPNPSQASVVIGVVAYAKCIALGDGALTSIAQCDLSAIIDQLAGPAYENSKPAARTLAGRLLSVATATKTDTQRVQVAVDTLLDTSCMLEINARQPVLSCADVDTIVTLNAANDIAFLEAFVDAAIATDSGRMVVVAAKFVDLVQDLPENKSRKKSALRLLAGLLDYGATFADSNSPQDQVSQAKLHDQRTKILESLTADMSDRTGRDGDDIFSLGGALRLVGGVRIGSTTSATAFYGPISLPLGIAYTHVPQRGTACGIHMQLDAFDLGNYVAFEQGGKVMTPEVGDAVSPSLSVGVACGRSLPFVIAPTFGYTPQLEIDPNHPDKTGAWDVGLSVGVNVPLIDLN